MSKRHIVVTAAFIPILVLLAGIPVWAQGIPMIVDGTVTIDGLPATDGVRVEARNHDVICGQAQVSDGGYAIAVNGGDVPTPGCFSDGDPIWFFVEVTGGFQEAQQAPPGQIFRSGGAVTIDLLVTTCPDFNGDDQVTVEDIERVAGAWSTSDLSYDLSGDGVVTIEDIMQTVTALGPC